MMMRVLSTADCDLGPVVQSIVSLTKSLRHQLVKYMWTTLSNALLFFVAVQKILTFFSTKKQQLICDIYFQNFNETLTNGVFNFKHPGQDQHH